MTLEKEIGDREKFTKGPWEVFHVTHGKSSTTAVMLKGTRKEIISWTGFDASHFYKDNLANAHLIAAAPELYESLRGINPLLPEDTQRAVDKLLAKARGQHAIR
jgi:hypothetical protein